MKFCSLLNDFLPPLLDLHSHIMYLCAHDGVPSFINNQYTYRRIISTSTWKPVLPKLIFANLIISLANLHYQKALRLVSSSPFNVWQVHHLKSHGEILFRPRRGSAFQMAGEPHDYFKRHAIIRLVQERRLQVQSKILSNSGERWIENMLCQLPSMYLWAHKVCNPYTLMEH